MKYLLIIILALSVTSFSYAAGADTEETIELTTYYPAPYGDYDELQSNKLAVGSNAAIPTDNGVLQFERLTTAPAHDVAKEGTIYYDAKAAEKKFKFNDGSGWQDLGGAALSIKRAGFQTRGTTHVENFGQDFQVVMLWGNDDDGGEEASCGAIITKTGTGFDASFYYTDRELTGTLTNDIINFLYIHPWPGDYDWPPSHGSYIAGRLDENGDVLIATGHKVCYMYLVL